MAEPTLLPDPRCFHLLQLEAEGKGITVTMKTTALEARCPLCAGQSTQIHSHYRRVLADLPWMGCAVRLLLHVRRFFCQHPDCQRKIFTERVPDVVAPYARRTLRLQELFTLIGFALGGEAGKRLMRGMGLQVSPDTLLRLIHEAQEISHSTPRVLGVDDFSFRRRHTFGTILIDLEKRVPVDLLPDREAKTFAKWLMAHPGVEIISRDRGGDYAKGAKQGAPNAKQTVDRWHLLKNLGDALESFFLNKKDLLKEVMREPGTPDPEIVPALPWHTGGTSKQDAVSLHHHQERIDRYHHIQELSAKKVDVATIARQVGVSRQTVYNYLRLQHPPDRQRMSRMGKPLIEPYAPYLLQRWNEGCRNGQLLYREIRERGYTDSVTNVTRFVSQLRHHKGTARSFKTLEPTQETMVNLDEAKAKRPPTALQVASFPTFKEDQRLDWQNDYLTRLCEADPQIRETSELIKAFTTMLREREGERLDSWLTQVEKQGVAELQSFAQGLQKDYDAVKAGLTLEWSQGQVEGQVHRLKLLKRQSYGRASFQTLRKRVLQRA